MPDIIKQVHFLNNNLIMQPETKNKYRKLNEIIKGWDRCVIAFSGGCDSTFLLKAAVDVLKEENVLAVTARSPSFPAVELQEARRRAKDLGVKHLEFETSELDDPNFTCNSEERCYYCKLELFSKVLEIAGEHSIDVVSDASNYDDEKNDYRPGLKALKHLGIRSPLKEAQLTKPQIREISYSLGLSTHDKPPFACLASRFPYGEHITAQKLERVGKAESVLRKAGFKMFRVRSHGEVARIELGRLENTVQLFEKGMRDNIVSELKALGYIYVTLDLEGYRTGSMNEALGEKILKSGD